MPCPCSQGSLDCVGSRSRKRIRASGAENRLIIRRLQCEDCQRIHHELPDILVPYKRYDGESIERALTESTATDVAADDATLSRWRSWFQAWLAVRANLDHCRDLLVGFVYISFADLQGFHLPLQHKSGPQTPPGCVFVPPFDHLQRYGLHSRPILKN